MINNSTVDVTAIIVNYNTCHLLEKAVADLRQSAEDLSLQIIIVDNASRDDSVTLIERKFQDCDFIKNTVNVGFGRANNQALKLARGQYLLLLNTDAFVSLDTLNKTINYINNDPSCGVLGVKLLGRDGELQPSCRYFPTPLNVFLSKTGLNRLVPWIQMIDQPEWDDKILKECDWVPGCYYLTRRSLVEQLGLFDSRFFLYYEEVDHCRTVKAAGWKVIYYPYTSVVHIGGESAKSDASLTQSGSQISTLQIESELLYFRKHYGLLMTCLSLVLNFTANVILLLKEVVRHRTVQNLGFYWNDSRAHWSLFRKTSWARVPSR